MKCVRCNKAPRHSSHRNAKYCDPCRLHLLTRPVAKLTREQERQVRRLAGTMYVRELADKVGVSRVALIRWGRDHKDVNMNALRYPDAVVKKVCEYYAKHGKVKTQKRYPGVKVRSIVERYFKGLGLEPRQIRWEADQLIQLAQMAGLISPKNQARFFNRPRANRGSIVSVWMKTFGIGGGNVNGLSYHIARHYVRASCPVIETDFWRQRVEGRGEHARRIALWVDVDRHLRADTPKHLAEAIKALANFQRWLHGRNARLNIKRIIKERGK